MGATGKNWDFCEETDLGFAYEDFLSKLEARGYAAGTIRHKRWILREFVMYAKKNGIADARQVTGEMLRGYISHVSRIPTRQGKERYSRSVIEMMSVTLRVFFRHLAKRGLLLFDPGRAIEKMRSEHIPPTPLSPLAVERVLALPDTGTPEGLRDRAILELFYGTGIRRAELASLCMEDLRMDSGTVFVRQGKGRRDRVVPAGERAFSWLRRYLESARPALRARAKGDDDATILFLGRYGRRLHPEIVTKIGMRYLRMAGIERGACHILRHSCATEMLSNGADIVHIQELLGHERASTSQLYTHVTPERLREKYVRSHPSVFGEVKVGEKHAPTHPTVTTLRKSHFPEEFKKGREFSVRTDIDRAIIEHLNFRSAELAARSLESFRFYLQNFSEWCLERGVKTPSRFTTALLEGYQRHLSKREKGNGEIISLKTQKMEMEVVCSFVRWCHGRGLLLCDPSAAIELPRVGKSLVADYMTREDVERVLSLPDTKYPYGLRDRAILEILYATGIRATEFCALALADADFERDSLRIHVTKLGRDRVIPVSPRAMKWLHRYVYEVREQFVREQTEILFLVDTGRHFRRQILNRLCRKYLRLTGIENGSVHIFRHSCATHMIENGADLRTVQEFLGHRCIESTRVYAHISIRHLKEVHAKTHPAERRFLERMRMTEEELAEAKAGDAETEVKEADR
jgi:integrase/recombinase XerD